MALEADPLGFVTHRCGQAMGETAMSVSELDPDVIRKVALYASVDFQVRHAHNAQAHTAFSLGGSRQVAAGMRAWSSMLVRPEFAKSLFMSLPCHLHEPASPLIDLVVQAPYRCRAFRRSCSRCARSPTPW
jgi:hypothetical protein